MPSTPSRTSRVSVSYGAAAVTVASSSSDGPPVHDGHRDELLGEDVERVARDLGRLDRALVHPAGHDGAFEQVAAVLREDDALAGRPDLVAGPADPLEPAGDARRALDLDDQVDRAHVDPELEAGRGDQRGQAAGLELLLDREALLAGDAAVVGADELLAGQLVEPLGEPLAQAAAVGEHDRAAVAPDQLQDPRMDRRPDARPQVRRWWPGRRAAGRAAGPRPSPPCRRPGRSPGARAACARRHRRSGRRGRARRRPGTGRSPRAGAAWPTGRSAGAASRPGRGGAPAVPGSGRGGRRASCPAIAWTSSTITCSTPRSTSRAPLVSIR